MTEINQPGSGRGLPIVSVVTLLGFLDTYLLVPIIALYAAELGASVQVIGLIVGLYSLTNTPANILFGRLIDRIGYKVPLILGLVGGALNMFLYSVSRLPVQLALVRILHGITGASVGPATMSAMASYSRGARRGRVMSFYGMSIGIATIVGFGLSGFLSSKLGFNAVFLFGMAILVIGAILSLLLPGKKKGIIEEKTAPDKGWQEVKALLCRRGLVVAYCSIFAQFFTFGSVVTLLPLYVKGLGMEAVHVSVLLVTFSVMFIILQFPSGAISDKTGRRMPIVAGLILGAISVVALPLTGTFPLLIGVMAVYGIAFGMLFPSVSALIVDQTTPGERGMATGIFHALLTAGVAIGAPITGWVGGMVGVELGMVSGAGIAAIALVAALSGRKYI
ncbi:MFS transporter [Chloroflexota bacterium]